MTRLPQQQRGFGTSGDNTLAYMYLNYELSYDYAFYLFFHGGIFWQRLLPSCDLLRIALEYNMNGDGSSAMYGHYGYYNALGQRFGGGKLNWHGNYVGLELGYTFGRVQELRRDLKRIGLRSNSH